MFTFRNVRILFAAALLAAIFCLAGCSTAAQAVPQPAETSRSAEATPETAAPAPTSTPAPTATPEPPPAAIVPTSVTLDQEGGILNRGMTWTLRATVLPEDAADKTVRWTSSDASVATIDDAGVITALTPGQTTITAASEAGGVSTTYTLLVQEVATCSYCGGTGHTASACPSKAAAEQTQAAAVAQQAAEPAAPAEAAPQQPEAAQPAEQAAADPGYAVDWAGRRIYSQGDADIPEGGVVQRPDGSRYIQGPLNVIFGYDSCPEDTDLSQPGNTPFTGDCVFCGDYGHDVYHCPILAAEQDPDAFCGD
ncbi:Ig-like domain-containing protein [Gemmiger formicilis]